MMIIFNVLIIRLNPDLWSGPWILSWIIFVFNCISLLQVFFLMNYHIVYKSNHCLSQCLNKKLSNHDILMNYDSIHCKKHVFRKVYLPKTFMTWSCIVQSDSKLFTQARKTMDWSETKKAELKMYLHDMTIIRYQPKNNT